MRGRECDLESSYFSVIEILKLGGSWILKTEKLSYLGIWSESRQNLKTDSKYLLLYRFRVFHYKKVLLNSFFLL